MPPEQAQGDRVDERADVYALGMVLYHVLYGALPLSDVSPSEALHRFMVGALPDIAQRVPGVAMVSCENGPGVRSPATVAAAYISRDGLMEVMEQGR